MYKDEYDLKNDIEVVVDRPLEILGDTKVNAVRFKDKEIESDGVFVLIENGVTVISIITDEKLVEKTISNIQEVITRGAKTLVVTNQNCNYNMFSAILR